MTGLVHLLHRHTTAARADAGDIVLCHRLRRVDAHIRPAGHGHWIRLRDISFTELRHLLRAVDGPGASERLLFRANAIRMRRARAGA